MKMHRLLTLMMMAVLAFISGTSGAAALCQHRDAQHHEAALNSGDPAAAAAAHVEEAAGAVAANQGFMADAGAFALPLFLLPASSLPHDRARTRHPHPPGRDVAGMKSLAIPPLLEPPAA